ncbi:hydrophobin [Paxillus ammoniavirescens]|nr:hydrophobin [Paxillus ammoniavirescens]
MFIRPSSIVLPITTLVAATIAAPSALEARQEVCVSGSTLECCTDVFTTVSDAIASLGTALGITLPDVSGLVGTGCTELAALGVDTCTTTQLCCTVTYSPTISLGCSSA